MFIEIYAAFVLGGVGILFFGMVGLTVVQAISSDVRHIRLDLADRRREKARAAADKA